MIFRQNMIVIITNGSLAGKKAVVAQVLEDDALLLAGISRTPTESPDYLPMWQKRKNEKFVTFIKKMNIKHVLATRYTADVGLDKILGGNKIVEGLSNRAALNGKANEILKNAFDEKKAKWLFTSLKF